MSNCCELASPPHHQMACTHSRICSHFLCRRNATGRRDIDVAAAGCAPAIRSPVRWPVASSPSSCLKLPQTATPMRLGGTATLLRWPQCPLVEIISTELRVLTNDRDQITQTHPTRRVVEVVRAFCVASTSRGATAGK